MDVPACRFAGDPAGRPGKAGGLSVQSHGVLQDDQRETGGDVVEEDFVHFPAFFFQKMLCHFDPVILKDPDPFSGDLRVRVAAAGEDAADAGFDQGVRAGRLLPVVAAGLQRDVDVRAGGVLPPGAAVLQRRPLRVQAAEESVPAFADDPAVLYNHCAHQRVR